MKSPLKYVLLMIMGALLISISYYTFRHESVILTGQFVALFAIYLWLFYQKGNFTLKEIIGIGLLFRLLLLFLIPNLSEDIYRFIWDGKLWWEGIDAYAFLPSELAKDNILSTELFTQLNSPNYYSIYPPLNQLIFSIGAIFENTRWSIITIRLFVILAEIGTLLLLPKVLRRYQKDTRLSLLYAFNPLVILELSGNLHFEVFVIFFLLLAINEYEKRRSHKSALAMGMAIGFKLVPLILLAGFFKKIALREYLKFVILAIFVAALTFLPFLFSDALEGILTSTSLYFQSFEFNASIYYLIREIGFGIKGYNIIATAGPVMGLLSFLGMLGFNLLAPSKMKLPERMLWTYLIYLLFATTVHPWYILPILVLGILSGYWFPIAWAFLVFFTYWGYSSFGYQEQLGIVVVEYISLIVFAVFEVVRKYKSNKKCYA